MHRRWWFSSTASLPARAPENAADGNNDGVSKKADDPPLPLAPWRKAGARYGQRYDRYSYQKAPSALASALRASVIPAHEKAPEASAERDRVARLVADFSIEALPREVLAKRTDVEIVPPGTSVFLTRIAKKPFRDTLQAAIRLRELGLHPVPHLTARTIRSERELHDEVTALVREAGVDEILLVAGSEAHPAGVFDGTIDVLRTGVFERAGIKRIGLAGHPEGHPAVDEARLQSVLDQKNDFARNSELDCYLITQFFFDTAPVIAWERRIRKLGNTLPIRLGVHGLTGTASLLKYAIACGIGKSLEVLATHTGLVQLAAIRTPQRLLVEFATAIDADPGALFSGVHFFPLGGFARTARYANALAASEFSVGPDRTLHLSVPIGGRRRAT